MVGLHWEGCDSIQVSGCQTRAWRSTFYTRASLVHMVLGVLILYWFPFYARLEARLGVQSLYYAKIHPKIKPLFLFFTVRLGGLDFTQMYAYIEYYRIIYNILIYFILIFWIFLESYGFLWNLLDFYSKKIIEQRIKKKQQKTLKNKHWQGPVYNWGLVQNNMIRQPFGNTWYHYIIRVCTPQSH